jgi:acyl-CoA synthetase
MTLAPLPRELRGRYLSNGLWDDTTLGQLLVSGLRRRPQQDVRIWSKRDGRTETFESVELLARGMAGGLAKLGVAKGDRVVLWLPNGLEAVVGFVGLAARGAVIVPVATFYGRRDLVEIVNAADASVVITCGVHGNRDYLTEVLDSRAEMPGLREVVVCGASAGAGVVPFTAVVNADPVPTVEAGSPDDVCLLAFTSGTSGTSKGVVHTHRTLGAEIRHHLATMIPVDAVPQIMASPIAHAAGMTLGLLAPIHRGEPVNLVDTFDVDFILETARDNGLAPGGGASVFLSALIENSLFTDELAHRMGHVILGGSTVPESLVAKAASRGVTILRSYGLTEHPTVSAGRLNDTAEQLRCTDGELLPGVEVQVRDRSGAVLGRGAEGELFTRGPDRCAGYLQRELNSAFDEEGWLATGDIGVVDDDGHLAVTGRAKDLIIRNGVNISPAEVESALMALGVVADVAVIGVPHETTGERAVAVVVARDPALSLGVLTEHLATLGVAKPKWPEDIWVVDDLPRTASGKVRKNELREAWLR